MSSGVTQIVATGAQDDFIVGNPEVSFFSSVYKRHTNFAHVLYRQVIQGNPSKGGMSTVRFEKKADLLAYVYLVRKDLADIDPNEIEYVEFLIGGQVIDRQYYDFSVNIADKLLTTSQNKASGTHGTAFYPLHFWFCEAWSSALPLVSLQGHDVEIRITWGSGVSPSTQYECWCNYIALDTVERVKLASPEAKHILMYQTQRQPLSGASIQPLILNQPVKFLACSSDILNDTDTIRLQLNGSDIGDEKVYGQHCTVIPNYYHCTNQSSFDTFLHPFCLETSKVQGSGAVNFSRLDSARFVSTNGGLFGGSSPTGFIYAVNYNVLKIERGLGGLLYAN